MRPRRHKKKPAVDIATFTVAIVERYGVRVEGRWRRFYRWLRRLPTVNYIKDELEEWWYARRPVKFSISEDGSVCNLEGLEWVVPTSNPQYKHPEYIRPSFIVPGWDIVGLKIFDVVGALLFEGNLTVSKTVCPGDKLKFEPRHIEAKIS